MIVTHSPVHYLKFYLLEYPQHIVFVSFMLSCDTNDVL